MARRVLSGRLSRRIGSLALLGLGLGLSSCKHNHSAPTPAPAPLDSAAEGAQAAHFETETSRSRTRWHEQPKLGDCAGILHEARDIELCRTAESALVAVERLDPAATPESALPLLADLSVALARLLDRARYLTFEEFGRRRLEGDAGAPSAASASAEPRKPTPLHSLRALAARPALKLTDSPVSHLVDVSAHLEYDALRNLGAYLEYAPLPVRRSAFDTVKRLRSMHPAWPALTHVLREAAVLECDSDLKRELSELVGRALPQHPPPDQPTGSK